MQLQFSGAPEVQAPIDQVWKRLMDPELVASCAPGVESVEAIDDTHFTVVSKLGVGKISVRFTLQVELSDLRPPRNAHMTVKGAAPGSVVQATSSVQLEPITNDVTKLSWSVLSHIHGKLASVGARLLSGTTQKLIERFWSTFAERAVT